MGFAGFPEGLFSFYRELSGQEELHRRRVDAAGEEATPEELLALAEPAREWWAEHSWRYHEVARPAAEAFIGEVAERQPRWLPLQIYRPYHGVRFHPWRFPYKPFISLVGARDSGAVHYLHLDGGGLFTAAGYHVMTSPQLRRYRAAVDDPATGGELEKILDHLSWLGYGVTPGAARIHSGTPRGYHPEHPRIHLIRYLGLTSHYRWNLPHQWLHTRRAFRLVTDAWWDADPLSDWLDANVGPEA